MKILSALKEIEFAAKLFAAAGFNSFEAALAAKNENALKAHLDQAVSAAPAKTIEKVVEKSIEPTAEQLQTLVGAELRAHLKLSADKDPVAALSTLVSEHATMPAQLAVATAQLAAVRAAKIEFAADAKPEAVTSAIESRISMRAGEELAKHGLKEFPKQEVTEDPAKPKQLQTSGLTGLDRVRAAMEADIAKKK